MSATRGLAAAVAGREQLLLDLASAALDQAGIAVVGHASSWTELRRLCRRHRAAIAVVDASFAARRSADELGALRSAGTHVLALSSGDELPDDLVFLGVAGYLHVRDATPERLARAARAVAAGEVVLPPALAGRIVEEWRSLRSADRTARPPALTAREAEVLAAVARGLGTKGVARALGISSKTVENHKARIFTKLGVHSQAHAIAEAIAWELLPESRGSADARPA